MNTKQLLPCPFCGGRALLHEVDWCTPSEWGVACDGCHASGRSTTTKARAAAEWNRRAPFDATKDAL